MKTNKQMMKTLCITAVLSLSATIYAETLNFNPDWRFVQADIPGAEKAAFDDSAWSVVSAPHTYNDVDTFDDFQEEGHVGERNQWGGKTWYRKTFIAPDSWADQQVIIEFEAVRQVAEVFLNGEFLGKM